MPRGHVSSPNYYSKTLESLADARLGPSTSFFRRLRDHKTCSTQYYSKLFHSLHVKHGYLLSKYGVYIYLYKLLVRGSTFIWYITYLSSDTNGHLVQTYAHSLSILISSQTYTSLIHYPSATLRVHTYLSKCLIILITFNSFIIPACVIISELLNHLTDTRVAQLR